MDENPSHRSSLFALHAWRILAASGLSWAGWGLHQLVFIPSFSPDHWDWLTIDNIAVIPALAANDAERGWAWLTTDPAVID